MLGPRFAKSQSEQSGWLAALEAEVLSFPVFAQLKGWCPMRSLNSLLPALLIAGALFAFGCFGVDSPQSQVDASPPPPAVVAASPAPDDCKCVNNSPVLAKHSEQIKQLQVAIESFTVKAVASPAPESPPEKFTPPPPGLIVKPSPPVAPPVPVAKVAAVKQVQAPFANGNCANGSCDSGRVRFFRRR